MHDRRTQLDVRVSALIIHCRSLIWGIDDNYPSSRYQLDSELPGATLSSLLAPRSHTISIYICYCDESPARMIYRWEDDDTVILCILVAHIPRPFPSLSSTLSCLGR